MTSNSFDYDAIPMPDLPPEARILTAPAGGGKTEAAIDAILSKRLISGFAPIWVLLASGQQVQDFQARLVERSDDQVQMGVEFFLVDELYRRVLNLLGEPQRRVRETARYGILRHVIAGRMAPDAPEPLEYYANIAHTPGFVGLVAGLIHELKQGLVEPEVFEQVAAARGPKDRDLARIYGDYQEFLQRHRLVDRHGAGWLAVRRLESGAALPAMACPALLVVDGFDQFNMVHRRLITALAQQIEETLLTLTLVETSPGRVFRRFDEARTRLLEVGKQHGGPAWSEEALNDPVSVGDRARPPVLAHLVDQIFRSMPDVVPGDESLLLIEAPDIPREVVAALRHVKRLLLAGVAPDEIAVIVRDLQAYSGPLRETARAYDLPLVVRASLRVRDNPAVAALLALLDVHTRDFPRRELIDTLQSPYLTSPDLTRWQIAQLERVSRAEQVVRGREVWLAAVQAAGVPRLTEDGETEPLLAADEAGALLDALAAHMDRITPPEYATVNTFVAWVTALLVPDPAAQDSDAADALEDGADADTVRDPFTVLAAIRRSADAERVTRDVRALGEFRGALAGLRAAHALIAGDAEQPEMSWVEFRAELDLALQRALITPPGGLNRLGRVLATDARESRGLPHDHVIIMGLAESVFPRQESDDGLYSELDRLELEQGTPRLDMLTYAEREDDMSLFYQSLGLARASLTLTRFTVDDKGTEVPPSPYWDAVRAVVAVPRDQMKRLAVGAAPTLDDAANWDEVALALAAVLSGEQKTGTVDLAGVHALLRDLPAWENVLHGRAFEAQRDDPALPFDRASGVLVDERLVEVAARMLGPDRVWSASQFDEYGTCPFRFFARRLLRLEELEEPEEGPDVMQTGSLNHKVLEETYTRVGEEGLDITPENQARALDILHEVAGAIFPTAPQVFGFRASPVWEYEQRELLRRLHWLVELDFSDASPFRLSGGQKPSAHPVAELLTDETRSSYWQEAVFGFGDAPPLEVPGEAGVLRVRGKIDRMDRAGKQVVVVDYKTGTSKRRVDDMAQGRAFQMAIYLLAAEALMRDEPEDVAGGLFWHIRSREASGEVLAADPAVELARQWMHIHALNARSGFFAVRPSQPTQGMCSRYCEFKTLCRYGRAYSRKAVPDDRLAGAPDPGTDD